ncbi:hypothetical protein [Alicycliphilus denitrificans]|uniref:DUF3325 domain-containing protein n=1 Tax=Alicycliphilus denitrificans TaxID=179636 RepID=A0A3R7LH34_9BURK|nr:hypothetical protein [Alicycliphilus denitrificans]RKJ99121.1 hypothetical protein CE154_005105 [Alicycliphilus denitrificans]
MPVFTLLGLAAATQACLCLYAASPNQRLWAAPWPRRPARIACAALLLLAWLALVQDMHRLTAAFVLGTTLMLALAVLPYAGALTHARRTR